MPCLLASYPDRSRSSASPEVRDVWDVSIKEVGFVPYEVQEQLLRLCNSPDGLGRLKLVLLVLILLLVALPCWSVVMLVVALSLFTP